MKGSVRLVGIGPGALGLLTLRAAQVIAEAESVFHPDGVEDAILHLAQPRAAVAELRSRDQVIEEARKGRRVVVLYPGDPYLFAPGASLAVALEKAEIEFEVIPGVPIETAAAALSGVPLTVEGRAASILIGAAFGGDSVVIRLAPGWWESGLAALLEAGHDPATPAAFIVNPGSALQRRVSATLGSLGDVARASNLQGDALLIVGSGVEMGDRLDTRSRKPLFGRRILVTRARHQAEAFSRQLEDLGGSVIEVPTIEIQPTIGGAGMSRAIERLPETGLVVFTSANAVSIFFDLLFASGHDARDLSASKVCAVGSETARSLEVRGIRPEVVAGEYTAEGLAEALRGWDLAGTRVLVPRAKVARDALPPLLARQGAEVEILTVYETVRPASSAKALQRLFRGEGADVVTFTSSSTVQNFADCFPDQDIKEVLSRTSVACMGPVTADTARHLGIRVDIIAREYTTRGLALAIAEALST